MTPTKPSIESTGPGMTPRRKWTIIGIVAAVTIGLFALGVYRWNWHGTVTRMVSKVVPYPAAVVDGNVIRWSDFEDNVAILEKFYDKQRPTAAPGSVFPSESDIKQRVLDRMIRDELALSLASERNISVSTSEIQTAYGRMVIPDITSKSGSSQSAAELKAEQTLEDSYGISAREYKNMVLRPLLVRQKLADQIRGDDTLNAAKLAKAKSAAYELRSGADFKETALKYSEDPNLKVNFGDRGHIGTGLMPPEVDLAISHANKDDVIGPIKSALGWHVLKVGDTNSAHKTGIQEIVVYPVTIDEWLEAQLKKANVTIYIH